MVAEKVLRSRRHDGYAVTEPPSSSKGRFYGDDTMLVWASLAIFASVMAIFGLDECLRSKLDICRDIGAACLRDDNLRRADGVWKRRGRHRRGCRRVKAPWNAERARRQRMKMLLDRDGVDLMPPPSGRPRGRRWAERFWARARNNLHRRTQGRRVTAAQARAECRGLPSSPPRTRVSQGPWPRFLLFPVTGRPEKADAQRWRLQTCQKKLQIGFFEWQR